MLAFMDDRSFSEFIGRLPPDVDAVYRATLTRSSGEPEQLAAGYGVGYFHLVWNRSAGLSRVIIGGSSRLIEGLAAPLGDRIWLGCEVGSVAQDEHGVEVGYRSEGVERTIRARAAVVAAPAPVARRIVQGLPEVDRPGARVDPLRAVRRRRLAHRRADRHPLGLRLCTGDARAPVLDAVQHGERAATGDG